MRRISPDRTPLPIPGPSTIDLWQGRSDSVELAALEGLLSGEERERGARFRDPEARVRFEAPRAALRAVLARYLEVDGDAIGFGYGHRGRPEIEEPGSHVGRISFNVSHTGSLFAIAVSAGPAVGVDVEVPRDSIDFLAIASRFFAPTEVETLARIADEDTARRAFFECWTRKEAYLKATGGGIAHGLRRVEVSFGPESGMPRILALDGSVDGTEEWSLIPFDPGMRGAVGCVAVRARAAMIRPRPLDLLEVAESDPPASSPPEPAGEPPSTSRQTGEG